MGDPAGQISTKRLSRAEIKAIGRFFGCFVLSVATFVGGMLIKSKQMEWVVTAAWLVIPVFAFFYAIGWGEKFDPTQTQPPVSKWLLWIMVPIMFLSPFVWFFTAAWLAQFLVTSLGLK